MMHDFPAQVQDPAHDPPTIETSENLAQAAAEVRRCPGG